MKIKLFIFYLLTSFILSTAFSQPYKFIYYLDGSINSVEKSKAILTGRAYYQNGLLKMDCFNKATEKMILSATFTDSTLGIMQGLFQTYRNDMSIESEGNYENNDMQGLWQKWDDKGLKTDSMIYEKGIKIAYAKFTYHKNKSVYSYAFTDSMPNTFTEKYFSEKGNVLNEVIFAGQKGVLKIYDSTGASFKIDSVFSREEIEATFPGGDAAWSIFLQKNLNTEVPENNKAPAGTYTAIVRFIVTKDGTLDGIKAETFTGYGTENEVIRIMKKSPKWIPAKQYGRNVNAYRRQPVTFMVESR